MNRRIYTFYELNEMTANKIILSGCCLISFISIFADPVQSVHNFPIAGNRTIAECINGKRPKNWNADMYITTTELARQLDYPAEEHVVLTEDGYILTLHRIKGANGAPPVLLQHGLFGNSYFYVVNGKNQALAFILADKGYDVWLGNSRGSTYSMCHTHYTPSDPTFWNFSWHEMGTLDLPAEINYITNITRQNVILVGVSMGATFSYVMAIERPDTAAKVKAIFGLEPVVYLEYLKFKPLKIVARFVRVFELIGKISGGELSIPPKEFIKYFCFLTSVQSKFCATLIFSFCGFDYQQLNFTLWPTTLYHLSSTSWKTYNHYLHIIRSNRFEHYDYGKNGNLMMYNSIEPPIYDISKLNVPVGIFRSINDYLLNPKDVQRFYKQVPNKILNYVIKNKNFNHIDSVLAIEAPKYVYSKLLSVMENYR